MEASSYIKYNHASPKKMRFLLGALKKLTPKEAREKLSVMHERSAKLLLEALKTAMSDANQKTLDETTLKFKAFFVEEGPAFKRFRAGSRGMARPYKRRTAHIKVVLEGTRAVEENISQPKLPVPTKKETKKPVKTLTTKK